MTLGGKATSRAQSPETTSNDDNLCHVASVLLPRAFLHATILIQT
jgi:hypothetical protein